MTRVTGTTSNSTSSISYLRLNATVAISRALQFWLLYDIMIHFLRMPHWEKKVSFWENEQRKQKKNWWWKDKHLSHQQSWFMGVMLNYFNTPHLQLAPKLSTSGAIPTFPHITPYGVGSTPLPSPKLNPRLAYTWEERKPIVLIKVFRDFLSFFR